MRHSLHQTIEFSSRHSLPLFLTAIIASASAVIYLDSAEQVKWNCEPISASGIATTRPSCFEATLSDTNLVSLHWKLADKESQVYVYNNRPPHYQDPGFQVSSCNPDGSATCSVDIRVVEGGSYRWTLSVSDGRGQQFNTSAEISLKPPSPPALVTGGGFVDLLKPVDQSFSWSATSNTDTDEVNAWVEIKPGTAFGWPSQRYPRSGPGASYEVPADTFVKPGEYVFRIRDCRIPSQGSEKFCSPAVTVGYRAGYDHFTGYRNRHVPPGESIEVSFTTRSGDVRLLSSETLLGGATPVPPKGSTVTIEGSLLTSGAHEISINSCLLPEGPCSNRHNAQRASVAGVFWQKNQGVYAETEVIGTLFPLDNSTPQIITAPVTGQVHFLTTNPFQLVEPGQLLAYSITEPADVMKLVVGAPIEWTLGRPYIEDFHEGIALPASGFGQALDIAFDKAGGIWMLNEFSNSIEYAPASGGILSLPFPIARNEEIGTDSKIVSHTATRPFSIAGESGNTAHRTTISALAEKVEAVGSKLWFTQGGGLLKSKTGTPNHSRIISYDPDMEDSARTPFNDRFCVYNLPAEDSGGLGNAQVIGLTGTQDRIWIAESRGITNSETSYLSSFVPDSSLCQNLLNFDDPMAVATQPMRYCSDGRSPEQDGCVQRIPMPSSHRAIKIAHLQADTEQGLIWFTDASGQYLGSYDLTGEEGVKLRPIPNTHLAEFDTVGELGGFPWDLEVTSSAVYVGEYASRHILRFDKVEKKFSEVSIPYIGKMMRLHSMALDALRQRLWFTLANECAAPGNTAHSTLGYIDLESWQRQLELPNSGRKIQGTLYRGLENIPSCEMHPDKHQSFRGIAFDAKTGKIALATMLREQITLLEPLPGFWP